MGGSQKLPKPVCLQGLALMSQLKSPAPGSIFQTWWLAT